MLIGPALCPPLTHPANGAFSSLAQAHAGQSVAASCAEGYSLSGASTLSCQPSGSWSSAFPICLGKASLVVFSDGLSVNCPLLSEVSFGTITPSSSIGPQGTVVTLSCERGYSISGSSSTTCLASGQWSNSLACSRKYLAYVCLSIQQVPASILCPASTMQTAQIAAALSMAPIARSDAIWATASRAFLHARMDPGRTPLVSVRH